ncbi:MAG: ATPase [Mucilaginibacter polytrichastri]|nr:ATPase [Mucilaginibacter polytrichastri]
MKNSTPVGKTKSAGFEFGLRKTFSIDPEHAWSFLLGEGLPVWLGTIPSGELAEKKSYRTKEGTEGEVRILKPGSHIRLTWKPKNEQTGSSVQVRVLDAKGKATIAFHHEKLRDAAHREQIARHWNTVMDEISKKLG